MSGKKEHEKLHFYRYVETELNRIAEYSENYVSDESLRIMKRIYRQLRILILSVELAIIDRMKEKGKLTPKQARSEKAKLKKKWL